MLIVKATLTPWKGEPVNGIRHPRNIEKLWTPQALGKAGFSIAKRFVVPDGHRRVGEPTYAADGTETYATELIPPPTADELAERDAADVEEVFRNPRTRKLLLNIVNRILKLEGGTAVTAEQLKTYTASLRDD